MTKENRLLVSIVIPMRNAEKFVSETLTALLREKETPIEVIVVNDKSTDRSLDRVLEFKDDRLRVIDGPGRGIAGALNAGYAEARGSIIMSCDADDVYPPERISRQAKWLASHPEFDAVCGTYSSMDAAGRFLSEIPAGDASEITDELLNGKVRWHFCTYAVRSSLISRVGQFREFFKAGHDLDYQLRMSELGRIGCLPENMYFLRLHQSSITHTEPSLLLRFEEQTALELHRQRRTTGLDDLQRGRPPSKPDMTHSSPANAIEQVQGMLIGRAWHEHRDGKKLSALRTVGRALAVNPTSIAAWKSLFALILKPSRSASS